MVYELTANVLSCYVSDIRLTSSRCVESSRDCTTDAERIIHTVDTSDLKAQKLQSMNINISGGKVNMGNVVQGAMNKIGAAVKGAKA